LEHGIGDVVDVGIVVGAVYVSVVAGVDSVVVLLVLVL